MAAITTVITGSTSGIGKVTALELAKKGHAVYMLVRNIPKGERVKEEIITQTGNKNIYVIRWADFTNCIKTQCTLPLY